MLGKGSVKSLVGKVTRKGGVSGNIWEVGDIEEFQGQKDMKEKLHQQNGVILWEKEETLGTLESKNCLALQHFDRHYILDAE